MLEAPDLAVGPTVSADEVARVAADWITSPDAAVGVALGAVVVLFVPGGAGAGGGGGPASSCLSRAASSASASSSCFEPFPSLLISRANCRGDFGWLGGAGGTFARPELVAAADPLAKERKRGDTGATSFFGEAPGGGGGGGAPADAFGAAPDEAGATGAFGVPENDLIPLGVGTGAGDTTGETRAASKENKPNLHTGGSGKCACELFNCLLRHQINSLRLGQRRIAAGKETRNAIDKRVKN